MISIEADDVLFERARFNKPYRTIEVFHGYSHDVTPAVLQERPELACRPWIMWLDYDEEMDETKLDELDALVTNLPANSILLTTFNAAGQRYASRPADRVGRFSALFGDAFPVERFPTTKDAKDEGKVMTALGEAVISHMQSQAVQVARPGGFLPAFNLQYRDGSPMATSGGVLPEPALVGSLEAEITRADWMGLSTKPIVTPPLTQKETTSLRGLLPNTVAPSRSDVQALGFDLLPDQITSFAEHYLRYPSFVQTAR